MPRQCIASLLGVFVFTAAATAQTTTWSQFQGNAAHTGYVPAFYQAGQFAPKWTVTAASLGATAIAPGAVTDGVNVYASAGPNNLYGANWKVAALNAATGATAWNIPQTPYGSRLSAPTVSDGVVSFHRFGHSGISGGNSTQYPAVVGVTAEAGTAAYTTTHAGQWSSGSRPTVDGGQIFASGGYYGGADGYSAATGANQWTRAMPQQYGYTYAADATRIYAYLGSASFSPGPEIGTFYAINRSDGSLAFSIQNTQDSNTTYSNLASVALAGPTTALAVANANTGRQVVSYNLQTQGINWRTTVNASGNVAVGDGLIAVPASNQLVVLDLATGLAVWNWTAPAGINLDSNAVITQNLIFVTSEDDQRTYAIDRTTHLTVWSANYGGELALAGELFLISDPAGVVAFTAPVPEPAGVLAVAAMALAAVRRVRRRRG